MSNVQHTVPIGLNSTNSCAVTAPWFVNQSEYHLHPCAFEPLVNGEEAFGAVYNAIVAAKKSVCIICWGFQPSMYFVRSAAGNAMPIGALLEMKAMEGVQVRILCYAVNPVGLGISSTPAFAGESNIPGRHVASFGGDQPPTSTNDQYHYDQQWFLRYDDQQVPADIAYKAAHGMSTKRRTENLRFTSRGFSVGDRKAIAQRGHMDKGLSTSAKATLASAPSHHQKMVLVDYEDPQLAVGFVMGHNTLDEYWDTCKHSYFRFTNRPAEGRNGAYPRQDFSSRVRGPILGDLFANFSDAWAKETGEALRKPEFKNYPVVKEGSGDVVMAQLLRTQPQYSVQDIKKLYLQAVKNATQYIYIENQYFRWPPLAEVIKETASKQTGGGRNPAKHGSLYLFVITNSNTEGIGSGIVNSYRMLESLGRADTIPAVARQERAEDMQASLGRTRVEAAVIRQRSSNLEFAARQNPRGALAKQYAEDQERLKALEEQEKSQTKKLNEIQDKKTVIQQETVPGLKVHICTLVAPDLPDGQDWNDNYVYIHAKLMLIDDTFMTLGSANINTRSMEVDSELNIAHDRLAITQPLRRRLWGMHTDNRGAQDDPAEAFKEWRKIIDENKYRQNRPKPLHPIASLVEFYRDSPARTDKD